METKELRTEKEKMRQFFMDLPEAKKTIAFDLIEQAAFEKITLKALQGEIKKAGFTESYEHGATRTGNKISSSLQAYNTMVKNYQSIIRQLTFLLPDNCPASWEEQKEHIKRIASGEEMPKNSLEVFKAAILGDDDNE